MADDLHVRWDAALPASHLRIGSVTFPRGSLAPTHKIKSLLTNFETLVLTEQLKRQHRQLSSNKGFDGPDLHRGCHSSPPACEM